MSGEEELFESLESIKQQQAETRVRLDLANQHINTLFTQVQDLEVQFKTAIKNKKHSARYNLRQKLAVIMGLKIVYLNYCSVKTRELEGINDRLYDLIGRGVNNINNNNNDSEQQMDTSEDLNTTLNNEDEPHLQSL